MNAIDPIVAQIVANPKFHDAVKFKDEFKPTDGVDYGWVHDYAQNQYKLFDSDFKDLDDKAGWIVTYLGGAMSLLTLGTFVALAEGKINIWIIIAATPSIITSLLAVFFAVLARRPKDFFAPPMIDRVCGHAYYFKTKAKDVFLGQWHLCIVVMREVVARKAKWVAASTWCFFISILLFMSPFILAVIRRFEGLP